MGLAEVLAENDIELSIYTQALLEYIPTELMNEIITKDPLIVSHMGIGKKFCKALLDKPDDMNMYGDFEELDENLRTFMKFPGYQDYFKFNAGELPVAQRYVYKSVKGKVYLSTKEIFLRMQNLIYCYDKTLLNCTNSQFLATTIAIGLKKLETKLDTGFELIECSPEQVQKFFIEEVLEKSVFVPWKLAGSTSYVLFCLFQPVYGFTEEEVSKSRELYDQECDEMKNDKYKDSYTKELFQTCDRWLTNLHAAVKLKPEWFPSKNSSDVPLTVRLFTDNGRKYIMIPELVNQMERAGMKFDFMQLPENFLSSDVIPTIDFKEIFGFIGTDNMSKIEFVITPIKRAKHAAVPIPTRDGRFCIPAADALIQLLRKLILGKKLFQITDEGNWSKVEGFLNRVTAYFNGENVSYFFIDLKAFDEIKGECDEEFSRFELPNVTTQIRNVKDMKLDVETIKEELRNLKLNRVFPNILDYAELALEQILTSKYEDSLQTSDMYDAVEYCQLICIFEHFPRLKEFLHSQKSCNRVLNSNCAECNVPCNMKITKWEEYDNILDMRQFWGRTADGVAPVYPICHFGDNYQVYPAQTLIHYLSNKSPYLSDLNISEEQLAKHKEVMSISKTSEVIPFVLIGNSDKGWYHQILLDKLIKKKETISFKSCVEAMMKRNREHIFLRTMWKWSPETCKECVGVFQDELFYILPFLLKQQNLYTKQNAEKLKELVSGSEKENSVILQMFDLRQLKEVLDMFNINKEEIVLVPDYHFSDIILRSQNGVFHSKRYDSTYGDISPIRSSLWVFFGNFATVGNWNEILEQNPSNTRLKALYDKFLQCMINGFRQKNSYVVLKSISDMTETVTHLREDLNITSHLLKIKNGAPGERIKFRFFLDHPLVKLGNVFSDGDKEKLRNAKVDRWRMYVGVMLLTIEHVLKNNQPELKEFLKNCLRDEIPELLSIDEVPSCLEDVVVYSDLRFPPDVTENKEEFFKMKKINKVEATVSNVFRLVLYGIDHERATMNLLEEKKEEEISVPITPIENLKELKQGQSNRTPMEEKSNDVLIETKKPETQPKILPTTPVAEVATHSKSKEENKRKMEKKQKSIDNGSEDGAQKEEGKVEKCSKCYQTRLDCIGAKKTTELEKKKNKLLEKKLEVQEKELTVHKKREAEFEEKMKKKYEDELKEAHRKLNEIMKKYTEEKESTILKINELEQRLEWRRVEVNRKVDEVTRNKQRELDEKDAIIERLKEDNSRLTQQSKSKDILTRALQENIQELTQQLKSQDLILQTVPNQVPSTSSSNQQPEHPSTSSPSQSSYPTSVENVEAIIRQEKEPEELVKDTLIRLKDLREKIIKESSSKQERANKILKYVPGRETNEWVNYELRKFNVAYRPYLEALNNQISMIEKVDEIPPLPPAPELSQKFMDIYNGIVKKETELKAKNYTRNKAPARSHPPEELDDQECVICLADMDDREQTLKCSMCSRRYHKDCLEDWLLKKRLCPTCDEGMLRTDEFPMFK